MFKTCFASMTRVGWTETQMLPANCLTGGAFTAGSLPHHIESRSIFRPSLNVMISKASFPGVPGRRRIDPRAPMEDGLPPSPLKRKRVLDRARFSLVKIFGSRPILQGR